jgi:hypothetical protein
MIQYPYLKEQPSTRQVIDTFKGYNHNLRIGSGEFYEMENLTSDDYPVLSTRGRRGNLNIAINGSRGMFYVPGKGLFYTTINGSSTQLYLKNDDDKTIYVTELDSNSAMFALIGTELVIAPVMKVVNINSLSSYELGEKLSVDTGIIDMRMCDAEGNVYENIIYSPEPPSAPGYHQLWFCNAVGSIGLNQYEPASSEWVSITSTYIRIYGLGEHRFDAGDGVEISGLTQVPALNGSHVIERVGHGDIVIAGVLLNEVSSQDCSQSAVTIEQKVPKLDFIVESGNRIWGCKQDTNEIYACKLGDIQNWNCFQKLSTDSWVGSVGTPGKFTGAAVQNGYPVFYKETCKHKVWPSATGAHQITSTVCDGVEAGSSHSVAVLDGTVFYKSPSGICADNGGGVTRISEPLGDGEYKYACATIFDGKYYLNMLDANDGLKRRLFVYDIAKRLWHLEDGPDDRYLASGGGSLYSISSGSLVDLTGRMGVLEENVSWLAVTGDLGIELPEQKYISRLTLRLSLDPGATLEVFAQYDREQTWVKLGQVYGTSLRSFSLPVRPRRCDQLRLKLQGTGMCKIYSITKTFEKGSELV